MKELKPEELRIGNWVKWPEEKQPNEVEWMHGHWLGVFEKNYGLPCGIPLDDEWLEKLGFVRNNNAWVQKPRKYNDFSIWNPKGEGYSLNGELWTPKIEFVHQLQNLYFALTGNELTGKK